MLALLTAIFVLVGAMLVRSETKIREQVRRDQVLETLSDVREALASRIYVNIYNIAAVRSIVAMNPNMSQADFARAIEPQFRGDHDLRNIAVARGLVIRYMYPLEGNEAAIGLDYSTIPEQFEAVSRAINLREIVLAGPVNLVQGGVGLIARTPIFIRAAPSETEVFWGLSSSVIYIDSLFAAVGLHPERDGLRFAVRGKDALGPDGDVFWGDPNVFEHDPLLQTIDLPHGSWQLAAVPSTGWYLASVLFTTTLWTYYLFAIAIIGFTILLLHLTAVRNKTLDALQAAEERLKKTAYELTENIPVGTYTMVQPAEGGLAQFKFMSRRFLEISGVTREQMQDPMRVFKDIHPEDYEEWVAKNVRAFSEKSAFYGETRVIKEGKIRWVKAESNTRTLADGTTVWEGVLSDITAEKALEEQLIHQKEKAEAANIAKSQFLANMSHEIRTPLNGLIGFTELLKKTQLSPVQQQYVNNAHVSGHLLLGVITDILDFSKIEAGKLELEFRKTDLPQLMVESMDVVRFSAEKKSLELLLFIADDVPNYAHVDAIRLKQMLANLLSNAVKFTERGEVELRVTSEREAGSRTKLSFSVRDTGIGISESQRDKLFSVFSQADSSTTRKFGGTGLGLTISEMIAGIMGSKIEFSSTPGEGTTFFFDLVATVEEAPTPPEVSIHTSIRRCLIIDDNARQRTILEQMLGSWGFACTSCDSGMEALRQVEHADPFDVIFCDYGMPDWNGLDTIRRMGEQAGLTPEQQHFVLLHTAMEHTEVHQQCNDLGIRARLTKPVHKSALWEVLTQSHRDATAPSASDRSAVRAGSITEPSGSEASEAPEASSLSNASVLLVPPATAATSGPRVLIVEDVHINMLLMKAILKSMYPDVQTFEAANGKEAVEQFHVVQPDIIFMDVQMPEMDGYEATTQIRAHESASGRHVPIVALTAGIMKEEKDQCFEAGMDYFLTKPVESHKIKAILSQYFETN